MYFPYETPPSTSSQMQTPVVSVIHTLYTMYDVKDYLPGMCVEEDEGKRVGCTI